MLNRTWTRFAWFIAAICCMSACGAEFQSGSLITNGSGGSPATSGSSISSTTSTEGSAGGTSGSGGTAGHGGATTTTTSDAGTEDGGAECKPGTTKPCYTADAGTINKGVCREGRAMCDNKGVWGAACEGEVLPSHEVCNGVDDNCDGTIDEKCDCKDDATQPCYSGPAGTSGVGICKNGLQTCKNGAWSVCDGEVTPGKETCDGIDNDCNNAVDDGLGQTTCGIGPCKITVQNCKDGEELKCTPPAGSKEICDGVDNDCDGNTDPDCACTDGDTQSCYDGPAGTNNIGLCHGGTQTCENGKWSVCKDEVTPTNEICNGSDEDCDGAVDNGFGQTSCGLGPCKVTVDNCVGGKVQQCVPKQGSLEVCDGIDNDCNGQTDEGCTCKDGDTQSCYNGPGGTMNVGLCHSGTQTCNLAGLFGLCQGEVMPTAEVCDGKDNDCNGKVDENLGQTSCGLGPCKVTVDNCVGGNAQQCVPLAGSPEICDGIDNNCNGQTDENCPCGIVGTKQDCYDGPANTKGVGVCKGGSQICLANGWSICTGETLPSAEICNGADDNCNGQTDDSLGQTTCGDGLCQTTVDNCKAGKPQQCVPLAGSPETCDGIDNDCDGVVDNGCIGCADESVEQVYSPTMHGCNGSVAQCNAATLCKAGYHLCKFSEYVAQGGATTPPTSQRWIASCLRENCGAPHAATDAICGNCSFGSGNSVPIAWDCAQSPVGSDGGCNLGVISFSQKRSLGTAQNTCAYNIFGSPNNANGANCCVNLN